MWLLTILKSNRFFAIHKHTQTNILLFLFTISYTTALQQMAEESN